MESVCFNRVLGGPEPQDFLSGIGRIQIVGKSSVHGKYKDSLALKITEIITEIIAEIILLPLMRFALSIGRTAPGMGSEASSLGGYNGKMAYLLGGKSQGWSSFTPPFTTVE